MSTTSSYYKRLIEIVLRYSNAAKWNVAVLEWRIDDVEEDETLSESCIAEKKNFAI